MSSTDPSGFAIKTSSIGELFSPLSERPVCRDRWGWETVRSDSVLSKGDVVSVAAGKRRGVYNRLSLSTQQLLTRLRDLRGTGFDAGERLFSGGRDTWVRDEATKAPLCCCVGHWLCHRGFLVGDGSSHDLSLVTFGEGPPGPARNQRQSRMFAARTWT